MLAVSLMVINVFDFDNSSIFWPKIRVSVVSIDRDIECLLFSNRVLDHGALSCS